MTKYVCYALLDPKTHHQVFIDFLPKYIGMTRPPPEEPEEEWEKEKESADPGRPLQPPGGRRPGGEYFTRNIDPDRVLPWTDR